MGQRSTASSAAIPKRQLNPRTSTNPVVAVRETYEVVRASERARAKHAATSQRTPRVEHQTSRTSLVREAQAEEDAGLSAGTKGTHSVFVEKDSRAERPNIRTPEEEEPACPATTQRD